jgi:hypothetical protein
MKRKTKPRSIKRTKPGKRATAASILDEAFRLVNGPKRADYGTVEESFTGIAAMWTVILKKRISPHQVALCMTALKLCREAHAPKRDNRVDGAAYWYLADLLVNL